MPSFNIANRTAAAAIVAVAGIAVPQRPAHAGPLCEWLFGHHTTAYAPVAPAVPYAAGYPVAAGYPHAAGYPVTPAQGVTAASPYAASYSSPVASTPYAAGYPAAVGAQPAQPTGAVGYAGALGQTGTTGASALQMPSYSAAYPGTVAGAVPAQAPSDRGYSMYAPPAGSSFPVAPIPQNSFYGTGNVYPNPTAAVAPVTAYQVPIDTTPSTIQTAPMIPAAPPRRHGLLGGLSRFFGHAFGTGYQTSYYRAPVTYYRPMTTTDPTSGAAVVMQQPCTSYEDQIQRSPVTTLAPSTTAPATAPTASCEPSGGVSGYNPYGSSVAPQGTGLPQGTSIPQGMGAPQGTGTSPGYYGAPINTPAAPGTGYGNGPDASPVGPPQLDPSGRPVETSATSAPAATWWHRSVDRPASVDARRGSAQPLTAPDLQTPTTPRTDIRPLPAPEYPYPRNSGDTQRVPSVEAPRDAAPRSEADGRVAQATWGYKPIQWQTDADSTTTRFRAATDGNVQPAASYEPVRESQDRREAPRLTAPRAAASEAPSSRPSLAPRPSSPATSKPPRVYENSGWSSAPRG